MQAEPTHRQTQDIRRRAPSLTKAPTGIQGLDEITQGGLPAGRPTLISGGPGCGKSLLGMEFLVHGARDFDEPGIFVSFEESPEDILTNYSSTQFDLPDLMMQGALQILHIRVDPEDYQETGPFDLEGLFVRIGQAVKKSKARRIVLDTIENLFAGLQNHAILRSEIHRLFTWLKEKGLTAIITGEKGHGQLTRRGLEEYVSDCVIFMDHRVTDQVSTRRLRVLKYRGTLHGTNEYPFLIDECGISLFPVTSMGLNHEASRERISTGVTQLDEMLGGEGYFRGSTILISGVAGAGKTSLACHFVRAAVARGERSLYFAFEESPKQLARNMQSIGIDLEAGIESGLLRMISARASFYGLELHLIKILKIVQQFKPKNVVLDPFTNFASVGSSIEVQLMLTRLIDYLKSAQITTLMTSLTPSGSPNESSEAGVSAWIDTWLLLRELESSGERNRGLYVLKSRGMAHSNQIREFVMTPNGIELLKVYLGPSGVLTGSARVAQEAKERSEALLREHAHHRYKRQNEQKINMLRAQIEALKAELASQEEEAEMADERFSEGEIQRASDQLMMNESRSSGMQELKSGKAG